MSDQLLKTLAGITVAISMICLCEFTFIKFEWMIIFYLTKGSEGNE